MEKRSLKRIPVSLVANILLHNHSYAAHIINISEHGLHMIVSPGENSIELTPGTEYKLAVTVPTGETFHLHCRVRWSSGFLHYRLTKVVGLMIIDPPPEYKTFYRTTLYEVRNDISHSPIAVIGMAGYYPGAPDLKSFWENILARRREFRQIPEQRLPLSEYYDPDPSVPDKTYGNRAAVIDGFEFDWIKRGIPKTVVESTDIAHWLALEVALKAMTDAGYTNKDVPSDRAGVVLGNTLTGEHSRSENMRLRWPYVRKTLKAAASQKGMSPGQIAELTETMEEYYKSVFSPITEDTLAGNLSNTIAGRICNFLNLNGGGYTVDGACSSSLIAVATAATALSNGKLDIALTGGVDISLDTFELIGFAKTNALTKDDMRVYDRKANGFIPGEGSGFVVLKRLEDARADGDRIYAVLRGWGLSSDGKGGITAPKAENQALAIRRAYTQAGYGLKDIDFIEGHGTGTPAGDKAELEGIAQAMDDGRNDSLRSCGITSLKSIIGHTKAASGIGGFIKTVIAVNRRVLPPTAGCTEPNPVFDKTAHAVYPILQGVLRSPDDTLRAGVSGMGFGGINCHVTLESGDAPAQNLEPSISERSLLVSRQNTELFVLSAESQPRLLERVQQLTNVAQGISIGEMVDLSSHLASGVSEQAPWRAALIASSPQKLGDSLKRLNKMLIEQTVPKGEFSSNRQKTLWVGNSVQQHRIGFLFPGQGSQQLNMACTLVERFPWARDLVDQADTWLANSGYEKVSHLIYRPLDRAINLEQKAEWTDLLSRTETAQPAICLASLLWIRYLANLGIKPVVTGGHSLGELTAFHMADALSEKDLLSFAAFRGMIMAADTENAGTMAGFACNREQAEDILQQIDGYAVVANINSPNQTVLSGEKTAVEKAMQIATAMDITCRHLPVTNGFHSQFIIGAADLLRREAQIPGSLEDHDITLLSCMEGADISPGMDLRNHFAQQMVSKVDFVTLANKMAKECDLLVEVGPGRVLTNLTHSCLDNNETCFPVEAQATDDRSLNTLLGCYFVRGGAINWSALYENRLVRPFVPPAERLFIDNPCERPLTATPTATRPFQTTTDEPVVSLLAAAADVPVDTISNYIHRRSRFLGNLIKADLDDSPFQQAPETLPLPDAYIQEHHSDITEGKKKTETTSKPTGQSLSVSDLLLGLIEKRTGFPKESLSLELRFLDDLNLDSIKAADLIAETATHCNLSGDVDPAQYANATIQEVADDFQQKITARAGQNISVSELLLELIEKRTGFPQESLSLDLRLLDDLNLDSIKAGDLLAEISTQLKVAGDFDVSTYANATLREITNAFSGFGAGNSANRDPGSLRETALDTDEILTVVLQSAAKVMELPAEAAKANALLGPDLNLNVEHCRQLVQHIAHELGTELNVDLQPLLDRSLAQVANIVKRILHHRQARQATPHPIAHRPWVREIQGQLLETPALNSDMQQRRRHEDNWQHARVLILGSEITGSVTAALQGHLNSLGAEVTLHEINKGFEPDNVAKATAYSHLILLLPQEVGDLEADEVRLEEMIARLASIASPPPAAAGPRRRTTVAYIQFGGGRFGMHPEANYINRCCASALAKSLHLERDDLRVRVLDFDPALPALTMAEKIAVELHMFEDFAAIGYDRSMTRRELKQRLLSPAEYQDRPFDWTEEDVILVTGGAKGITAACALEVSRATGARMALLGRSPHPDNQPTPKGNSQIASTLKKYVEADLTAQYYCCDVSDHDSVKKVIQQIRTAMGPITGVIHGAGLNVPRLINQVSIQEALQEVSPKILGILNLMAELQDAPPRLFVGLSSIIGVTGMPGNGWYGFSNETLDVLLHRIETDFPQTKALSVAFSIWKEEGMGTRLGSVSILKQKGIDSIPSAEGVKRFTRLFIKDPGVHQVIIAARLDGLDTWHWQGQIPEPKGRFLEEPLHITPGVESVFQAHLSLETDPYLKDHVFNESHLLPTVFGLEAMAQAVAHVTGQYDFSRVRIENILLKRPITVDPETGADIVVWAELTEPGTQSSLQTVHAGVYKQGAGPSSDYFSATFILGLAAESTRYDIDLPETPLDIHPIQDLYDRKLLFQGPRFQKLQHIYSLDSQKCIFDSELHSSNPGSNEEHWLLGDPFFRDSLLQSGQLPVLPHICLPIRIDRIERYPMGDVQSDTLHGVTIIENRTEEEVHYSVVALDEQGQIVERLEGYVTKILKFHPEFPTPEEIAVPGQRDETIILDESKRHATLLGVGVPEICVTYIPGLQKMTKEDRRQKELPVFQRAVQQHLEKGGIENQEIDIHWEANGKPVAEGSKLSNCSISLSHDCGSVVCAAGRGSQGCDIESITKRTREEWIALLGKKREHLLDNLADKTDSIDQAGTRIWTAMEAAMKAMGSMRFVLRLDRQEGERVIFLASSDTDGTEVCLLTFPLLLTRGPKRMFAVTIDTSLQPFSAAPVKEKGATTAIKAVPSPFSNHYSQEELLPFNGESFQVRMEKGARGERVFVFRFPVSFKEASNRSRTLSFSNYFIWIGKLREYIAQPIYDQLTEHFSSGNWGMVTNQAQTQILSSASAGDVIEARLWLDRLTGKEASTLEYIFEWRNLTAQGKSQLIAKSTMSITWVAIRGHGQVEVKPLPSFAKEYVKHLSSPAALGDLPAQNPFESIPTPDLGRDLYHEPDGPARPTALLREMAFETCLEDANLVGNIYFSHYYTWQGRVLDHFLHSLTQKASMPPAEVGEFRCVRCEINHLNEAMPYDSIIVKMYRSSVHEKGCKFYFDYFKAEPGGGIPLKLGYGVHEAIWHTPVTGENTWQPAKLPAAILEALIPKEGRNFAFHSTLDSHLHPRGNRNKSKVDSPVSHRPANKNTNFDVIVIGAGIGGLTAGGLLARNGAKVLVLEQHDKPGGYCTSWNRRVRHKGQTLRYVFDAGVHDILGLGPQGHIRKLLQELNVENAIEWRRVDHQYIINDLQIKIPRDIDEYTGMLCKLYPHEQEGIKSIFKEFHNIYRTLYNPKSSGKDLSRWLNIPFTEMLNGYVQDNTLKQIISILSCYITDDVSRVETLTIAPLFGEYFEGGYYPVGGPQAFSNTLARALKNNGGTLACNKAVSRILIEKNTVHGVELSDGMKYYAPDVISNADLIQTSSRLVDPAHWPPFLEKRFQELRPSNSAFLISLGVDFVPDVEPVTLVSKNNSILAIMSPSKIDPELAPEGHSSMSLVTLIPNEEAANWKRSKKGYAARKKKMGDALIEEAERIIPGLSNHIVYRQDASPATFARYTWSADGAIYSTMIDGWKPSPKTPIQGLYLTGASIAARPGVGDAVYSGMLTVDTLLRREKTTERRVKPPAALTS